MIEFANVLQGVPKVFIHLKCAVCGELVHLNFFWGNTKWKIVSFPHYLKILKKLSKHGINYSLKHDPRSISKITFYANLRVSHIGTKLWYLLFKSAMPWPEWGQLNGFAEHFFFNFASSFKKLQLNINWANTQIVTKCDFRDRPRITFEAVADAMFA